MLAKNNSIIKSIEEDCEASLENIDCWVKQEDDFSFYLFFYKCESESELLEHWNRVNNAIAAYFQSKLTKNIEIWNIYLFVSVKYRVSKDIKYMIEQDKYCSRKIVLENQVNKWSEESIRNQITRKLFKLEIGNPINEASEDTETLDQKLQQLNATVFELFRSFVIVEDKKKKAIVLENYLKEKKQ